ncbi:RING-H2 finger protein ATL7-like isoform X2 [Nymphaea colorata]|uniref:RING-H2 finger protein ATL7-like isoform X2 n=1 Tax=Nymphaea colorata TaxID=210225 RepID=UPI00129E7377|nr:RING-H2 finger protein ATL7-like isoform X2 [Nymphaea colorata]
MYEMPNNTSSPVALDDSPEQKLYEAFVFSVPIFFTFILLFLFYFFYLRRQRVDWSSLRMRNTGSGQAGVVITAPPEVGLKKEIREMLPVIIFKESFLIRETQCSVCLGDYESNERLQQIPSCGHTFHMECIDSWLTKNTTCPLCRTSLIPVPKAAEASASDVEAGNVRADREGDGIAQSQSSDRVTHIVVNVDCTIQVARC